MIDTSSLRIIFVHGLASKPPEKDLHLLWKRAFIENIRVDSNSLANALQKDKDLFQTAYWANEIPDHIEDSGNYVKLLNKAVNRAIAKRRTLRNKMHISRAGWAKTKATKFGLSMVNMLGKALTIKDDVIENFMREVRYYKNDQYIADRIRDVLENLIRKAWDENKKIILVTHSMGTFIAYDVLWRFSHRSENKYMDYRKNKINYFVTMGSPLGDEKLRDFMLIERWKNASESDEIYQRQRFFPLNLKKWHNFSAYGDVVCHDSTLEDDYFSGMRKNIRGYHTGDLMDYTKLYNPFIDPGGDENPHKSYGYLVQPKLSQKFQQVISSF